MDREFPDDERAVASKARENTPLETAIDNQNEIILALEKQSEVLYERLNHVSSRADKPNNETTPGLPGDSRVVRTMNEHTYRLRAISDRLSTITRELEI